MILGLIWMACQEPFDLDRHDLVGFRVAAIEIVGEGSGFRPRLAVFDGGHGWTDRPVDLAWYAVMNPVDAWTVDQQGKAGATGPEPWLPLDGNEGWAVVARSSSGAEQRAALTADLGATTLPGLQGMSLDLLGLELSTVTAEELQLEARRDLSGVPVGFVPAEGIVRMTMRLDAASTGTVRWMATAGTFLELDATTADWVAGDLRVDGDEIVGERVALPPGPVTVVALLVGQDGGTRWLASDIHVGEPGSGLWVERRWLPTDAPVSWTDGDAVRGVLVADDDSPTGLRLQAPSVIPESDAEAAGWGTEKLACVAPVEGPFDPGWLLRQRCTREGVIDHEIGLVPRSAP